MKTSETNYAGQIREQLAKFIRDRLPAEQAGMLTEFTNHYFKNVIDEDLERVMLEDLYGSLLSQWNLVLNYQPGTSKIHVYNPTIEEHGWKSRHTVIEIVVEDMPFLLQSITMEINRHGFANHLVIHPVFHVKRNPSGGLEDISTEPLEGAIIESVIHVEIDRQSEFSVLHDLKQNLASVLTDVRAAVQDWKLCLEKMSSNINRLKEMNDDDQNDAIDFLQWLYDNHFVFLGYREYLVVKDKGQAGFKVVPGSGLGVLRDTIAQLPENEVVPISNDAYDRICDGKPLTITKATSKATVHRPVFMDYIGIKEYGEKGEIVGEKRFLGLYSSSAYSCNLKQIPMVRDKIHKLVALSGFQPSSHDARALLFVLQSLPRDELFQADENSLFECAMGVLRLKERQRVKVFVRHDIYGYFVSVLVFAPRERYHTESRKKIQAILLKTFHSQSAEFSVQLSESILARIHFIIHSTEGCCIEYDVRDIEHQIVEALSEWNDDLKIELNNFFGEARGNEYVQAYRKGFSAAYREDFTARTALLDLKTLDQLQECGVSLKGLLYSPLSASEEKSLRFKVYSCGEQVSLSKSLPMLENMGVTVTDEKPYEIKKAGFSKSFWMHDFGLSYQGMKRLDLEKIKPRFQESFERCWKGQIENDGFNRLIIEAGLNWRQVNILRAFYFYFRQLDITFSQAYVEATLAENPKIVQLMVNFFYCLFDPGSEPNEPKTKGLQEEIEQAIDQVSSLDEDRILRRYLNLIQATVRTNYFKNPVDELKISYFAIKLNSSLVIDIPSPVPYFEIFVYSPRVEGIHLRGGAVARGGLRWSDRMEDFRTEVLGLMKAQMTKNTVIVPSGAKGGFVAKRLCEIQDKTSARDEAIACYRILVRGLLDLTDNLKGEDTVRPDGVVCHDGNDPYLVIAADKGTATFSDYANELSDQYGFWLGDAFASGGSAGYDHKKMGITARGCWESVKHHFGLLGVNIKTTPFSVIGIGGMNGDVFGNGMLLSDNIKLIGAFDHESIFLDPEPDREISFNERKRLFNVPKSSWQHYDRNLISKGGGIYLRSAKSIEISEEVKAILDIEADHLTPARLIQALLCAPVDLLWNGGIGTYVKASDELNLAVGDRDNDSVRVNGGQLRCKCVGEGGNLGFTQAGRIEYAASGGKINTDSIDNSAGVDCSDHEVNIKVLLDSMIQKGDLTGKQRNTLLEEMTDQVAELVLRNNYQQNRAISMMEIESGVELNIFERLIIMLESKGSLDRALEWIPTPEGLDERRAEGKGLYRPEISVLMAYSKQFFKESLLAGPEILNQDLVERELKEYFPNQLQDRFPEAIQKHRLGKEIAANQLVNSLINRLGMLYPFRLIDEMECTVGSIINAYKTVCEVFEIQGIWDTLEIHDEVLDSDLMYEIKLGVRKIFERAMYWFLQKESNDTLTPNAVDLYSSGIKELTAEISTLMPEPFRRQVDMEIDRFIQGGVAADLAIRIAHLDALFHCLDVIDIQRRSGCTLQEAASAFFNVIVKLDLFWVRQQVLSLPKVDIWESMARRSMRDEYNKVVCLLVLDVLDQPGKNVDDKIKTWVSSNQKAIVRYQGLLKSIASETQINLEKIMVILEKLRSIRHEEF